MCLSGPSPFICIERAEVARPADPAPFYQALAQATAAPAGPTSAVPQAGAPPGTAATPASSQALSQALSSGDSAVIADSLAQSSGGENSSGRLKYPC